jgi:hypothetical protein
MGRAVKNLLGKRFGRFFVLALEKIENGMVYWRCRCDCGNEVVVYRSNLEGTQRSCGCWRRERLTTHGQSKTLQYSMFRNARSRAKEIGVPFRLKLEDVPEMPTHCPILGIPLVWDSKRKPNSPNLDRKIPSLGYVPENIAIISERANLLKGSLTVFQLRKIIDYIENPWK